MSQIKGVELSATIRYLRKQFGEEGLSKIADKLDPKNKEIITSKLYISDWYPVESLVQILDAAEEVFGGKKHSLHYAAGKYSATESFHGIYKLFLSVLSPSAVFKSAGMFWKQSDSTGELIIEETGDGYAKGKLVGFDHPLKGYCVYTLAFMEQILELAGGTNAHGKELKCRCQGDDCCQYEIPWDAKNKE